MRDYAINQCLIPAGYLIVQDADNLMSTDDYTRRFGRYCGVDRLPPFIEPEHVDYAQHHNFWPIGDAVKPVYEEMCVSRSSQSAFILEYNLAKSFYDRLLALKLDVELLFCDVAIEHDSKDQRERYMHVDRPSSVFMTYGYDVAWPTCNHSAIYQPGVVAGSSDWMSRLNRNGLLDNYSDALSLRDEYLDVYPYPPFDIFWVHRMT